MADRQRLIPLIVGGPIFMQNLDSTAMAIAIPSVSRSLHVAPLYLNLAITSYLLSLAACLPLSAWMADRWGARRMFMLAIVLFSCGSALCATAGSLQTLVAYRIAQGFGAALMLPVGRLIMLRNVAPSGLMAATVWFTVPGVIGRMSGPLIGGAIVTYASWHWIFFLNIPVGLSLLALTMTFIEEPGNAVDVGRFDWVGFLLLAVGMIALMMSFESISKPFMPRWMAWLAAGTGVLLVRTYVSRSRSRPNPVIDLTILRYRVLSSNVFGAIPLRIAIGGAPFLLPLFLQLGLGFSPLRTGMLTIGNAVGALLTRFVLKSVTRRVGDLRRLLMAATLLTGIVYASYAAFDARTPVALMFFLMVAGGLFTSVCLVSLNSLAFVGIPEDRMSHATALTSMAQQITASLGVAVASTVLMTYAAWRGDHSDHPLPGDYAVAFIVVGILSLLSILSFHRLPRQLPTGTR